MVTQAAVPHRVPTRTLLKCLVEARPSVLAMYLLRFATGAALGVSAMIGGSAPRVAGATPERIGSPAMQGLGGAAEWLGWSAPRVLGGAAVWVLAILSAYLLNGVSDVQEDRANDSRRPIAAGELRPESAAAVAKAAAVLSLVGAVFLGPTPTLAVTAVLVLGYAYSMPPLSLKRHAPGAAGTGVAAALLSYLAGYASVAQATAPGAGTLVFSVVMSLWVGLVGTLAKDLPDAPGDAAAGRRTVAVLYGEPLLRRIMALAAGALGGGLWLAVAAVAPELSLPAWALTLGAGVVAVLALTHVTRGDRSRKRRLYRAFMATQYVTHLCLLVSVGVPSMVSS
ncbi:UbiA family prenyltransferase [Nonomuraea africana]|uniref:4-hydroxybenzoate polyprenyltransferase n=1 Tax=Nonomuraea africana TaxID=46171 RepID=A0ABR9KG38_9ACTN|nr:UbiA family prenyltransferase [Nonomuraea africana]MBE1560502.1 4-hydroxybenzoate polyprenyltransferase [Nonomuraea africana]